MKPNGRLGVVLPESVFDTTENKYIRLFLYKYFKIKAIVSLPQVTFEPYTSTKTSLLFAQKKTKNEIELWDKLWKEYSNEWSNLKTRCENIMDVYLRNEDRSKLPSIKNLSEKEENELICRMLKDYLDENDKQLPVKELVYKYKRELGYSDIDNLKSIKKKIPNYIKVFIEGKDQNKIKSIKNESEKQIKENLLNFFNFNGQTNMEIVDILEQYDYKQVKIPSHRKEGLIYHDNDTKDVFGFVNNWWVFSEVSKKLNYEIFMAEIENVGYKRTKRNEKPMPNELYRTDKENVVLVDDGIKETALDYLRDVIWD